MKKNSEYPDLIEYRNAQSSNIVRVKCSAGGGGGGGPLVSIVTVTFNAEKTIERTLQSVNAQTYTNIEHIIVDGGSTDRTLALAKEHGMRVSKLCSEPDEGIYDAFNKGVSMAEGEYIGILNADDYYEVDQIEKAVAVLESTGAPFVHGDMVLHGWQGMDVALPGDPDYVSKIRYGMPLLHQVTVLVRKEVFEKFGLFSTRYRIAGDFDWFLRLARNGVVGVHSSNVRAHMSAGGISTTRQRQSLWEVFLIIWRHGLPFWRALRATLPRLIFPNGMPPRLKQVIVRSRRLASLFNWRKYLGATSAADPIIGVFADARQVSRSISDIGLEWLYGVGLRSGSYFSDSRSDERRAVELMMGGGGAKVTNNLKRAHVVVIDSAEISRYQVVERASRQTILVVRQERWQPESVGIPFLDFGGVVAFGIHLDPTKTKKKAS